jgi:MSHA pilin protein MshC
MNTHKTKSSNHKGFTLIELITVIILISIMAVNVLPKFFTSNGFEEYTYRDELITKLRAIQLRTMQQSNNTRCHQIGVEIASKTIGLLATVENSVPAVCLASYAGDTTKVVIEPSHNVTFSLSEGLTNFSFSSLGKPFGCILKDPCDITITLSGESDLKVFINSEGYIYEI